MDKIKLILKETGLPYAYDHFAEGESKDPPFICWLLPGSNNFSADGRVYFKAESCHLELYTDKKDMKAEKKVEDVLDKYGIYYERTEVWIESEHLYEVLYYFELEA